MTITGPFFGFSEAALRQHTDAAIQKGIEIGREEMWRELHEAHRWHDRSWWEWVKSLYLRWGVAVRSEIKNSRPVAVVGDGGNQPVLAAVTVRPRAASQRGDSDKEE